ncbi:glycosyltransferase family 4 protein [Actinotalea sp.]|uniref:glycosyltransferase family 4 protein n=1 Tax=Actinotalea sp. TaxID=1872145 RepID=UPI003561F332
MSREDAGLRVALTVEQLWQAVPGGSGSYILELLAALAERDEVTTVGLSALHRGAPGPDLTPPGPVRAFPLPRAALYRLWNRVPGPRPEALLRGLDVVHATTWAIPPTRRPLVVTVHDLAFLRDPGHFTPGGVRFFTRALERTRDEADAVVVPSQATAEDCVAAGIEPERVHVVPHGAPAWTVSAPDVAGLRARLALPERFVLWCGTQEPRKNLDGLLRAFEVVAREDPDLDLVLVGPSGWGERHGSATGAAAGRVHELGRLPVADLRAAYAAATSFAFPSHWEGFGLPVLEAMSVGTPVVTSRASSMAEIVGSAGILVDPTDPADLAAGILRASGAEGLPLGALGRARAREFTWARSAEGHVAAYRAAAGLTGGTGSP